MPTAAPATASAPRLESVPPAAALGAWQGLLKAGGQAVAVHASRFTAADGVSETHLTLEPRRYASFETQMQRLEQAYGEALEELGVPPAACVLKRFFCSDLANQADALRLRAWSDPAARGYGAVSWVGQPPAGVAKVALWAQLWHAPAQPPEIERGVSTYALKRGALTHCWTTGMQAPGEPDSATQTDAILAAYETELAARGLDLASHAVRTWFFVRDIDVNYKGLVEARKALFWQRGLRADTHYLASSGIEAQHESHLAKVGLDAYAIGGLRPEQVSYLYARDHLSPTHVYGVTFERGTALAYRDRTQLLLSGTASIDHEGRILYPGNVARQLDRTLENLGALLAERGAGLKDLGLLIVYLRDLADAPLLRKQLRERFEYTPLLLVRAPVCRPGWLVEIEGQASIPAHAPALPPF